MNEKFDPYNHFGFLTHRVSRLMDLAVSPRIKAEGHMFPTSCIGILADLWSRDGVTQKELGSSIIKTKSSINKMLQALEENGMIVKKDDPDDKRNKLIFLTQKGRDFRFYAEASGTRVEQELLANHSEEEIRIAKTVLKTFYLNFKDKITNETSK